MFKQNEGRTDRIVRIVLGIVLLSLAFMKLEGTTQAVAALVGVLALGTGTIGYCPLYQLFRISTTKAK